MRMKADLDHMLFFCAYFLCVIDGMLIGYSTFNEFPYTGTLSLMMRACAAVLILIKLIFDRHYDLFLLLRVMLIGFVLLITYVKSGYSHIFYLMIICLGMRYVDENKLIRADLLLRFTLALVIVGCSLVGIIENYITYRTGSTVLRYSMGFNHPNTFASIVLSLILEDVWINKRRANGFYIAVVWCVSAIIYVLTANRTAVLIMLAFPVVLFFTQIWKQSYAEHRKGGTAFSLLFLMIALFSFAAMKYCRSISLFTHFDRALSNRFYNASVIYNSYGIPLLGQPVTLVSVKTARLLKSSIALLDVAYLRILIQAGPVVLLLMAWLYGRTMFETWNLHDRAKCLILSIFIVFGLCESGFNNVIMNFTLFLIAKQIFEVDEQTFGEGEI